MRERNGLATFQGNPLTLLGEEPRLNQPAPDVELLTTSLEPVRLSSFKGKSLVVVAVPSLDTPVCDMETRTFNRKAAELGPDVVVLAVSMDLPFAQQRYCGAAGIDQVKTLSDHREGAFGESYGVLIKGLRLLARSVFIIDKNGVLRYQQIVPEVTQEPDYDAVLKALKALV